MNQRQQQPSVQTILDNAWASSIKGMGWMQAVFLGEFADNRPLSAIVADMLVSFVPGVVIVTSARDAVAIILRIATDPKKREDLMEWVLLCSCLIVIALPLAMAAGSAVVAGVGAAVGGIAGSELGAALRALMLALIKSTTKLIEVVRFLQKFMKGDVLKFARGVQFHKYEEPIVQCFTVIVGKLIDVVKTFRANLDGMNHFDRIKGVIKNLSEWEARFYNVQQDALVQIPQALLELDRRLANVLTHTVSSEAHSVTAGIRTSSKIELQPGYRKVEDTPGKIFEDAESKQISLADRAEGQQKRSTQVKDRGAAELNIFDASSDKSLSKNLPNEKKQAAGNIEASVEKEKISELARQGKIAEARAILNPYVKTAMNAKTVDERKAAMDAIIDRLDVESDLEKYFWSGNKELAAKIAKENGGTILEQTPGGSVIDGWDELNEAFPWNGKALGPHGWDFWGKVSSKYSKGAAGEISVIQDVNKFPRGGDIWRGYEWPTIVEEGKVSVINIFSVDKAGKIQQKIALEPNSGEAKKLFEGD